METKRWKSHVDCELFKIWKFLNFFFRIHLLHIPPFSACTKRRKLNGGNWAGRWNYCRLDQVQRSAKWAASSSISRAGGAYGGASISAPTAVERFIRDMHTRVVLSRLFSPRAVIRNTLRLSDTSEVETTGRFCLPRHERATWAGRGRIQLPLRRWNNNEKWGNVAWENGQLVVLPFWWIEPHRINGKLIFNYFRVVCKFLFKLT